jgi:hypothetical protein
MKKDVIAYIKKGLRRTWGRSKQRQGALKRAKVKYGHYRCECCLQVYRRKDIEVDHIKAVGRFVDWDTYIERLFCDSNKLAVLCKKCHSIKTKEDKSKM